MGQLESKSDLSAVKAIVTCEICHNILEHPITLPCLKTICSVHLDDLVKDKSKNHFICILCNSDHQIPKSGFIENDKIRNLIESKAFFHDDEKITKSYFDNSIQRINKLVHDLDKQEPEIKVYIYENLSSMKNKIDLEVENLKKRIDNEHMVLFNKIDHFESKFKEELSKISKIVNNEKSISEIKIKWDAVKKTPSFNSESENNIALKEGIESKVDELEKKLKEFTSIKCSIDRLKFTPKAYPLCESLIGVLEEKPRKFKLITGGFDSNIKISDVQNKQVETLTGHSTSINSLVVNDDFLISGSSDGEIKVWDLNTHTCIRTLKQHLGIECLVITENGSELLSGLSDGAILKWNLKDWSVTDSFKEHTKSIVTMVLLPNNQLASCSHDKTIKIWDLSKDKLVKTLNNGSSIACMIVYKYNNLISGHCKVFKGLIKLWNIDSGICFKTIIGHNSCIFALELTKLDELISGDIEGTIKIWNLKTFECLVTLNQHTDKITSLKLIDNNLFLSCSGDNSVKIWNLSDYECIKTIQISHSLGIKCSYILYEHC